MKTRMFLQFAMVSATALSPLVAQATQQVVVDARSNIYGAGAASLPAPGGGGPGVAPVTIQLGTSGPGRTLKMASVTGTVDCCDGVEPNGPDGNTTHGGTNINPFGGLSGIIHANRRMFLVGVFLDSSAPTGAPPPPAADYTQDFVALSPALRQLFLIGDGLNQTGQMQQFQIPPAATRLVLGFADAFSFLGNPGWYDDNTGSLVVRLNVVSTPGSDLTYRLPAPVTKVLAGKDRVYAVADNMVVMLDRITLLPTLGSPIRANVPGYPPAVITAIGLYQDTILLVAGLAGAVPFVQGFQPPTRPSVSSGPPLWTWIDTGNALSGRITSITGNTNGACVFVGAVHASGLRVAKLEWGGGLLWVNRLGIFNSDLGGVSVHPAFSSLQVAWTNDMGSPRFRASFSTFAQSTGTPGFSLGFSEVWSRALGVSPAGPGKGVHVLGSANVVFPNPSFFLRRFSFDGTPVWTIPIVPEASAIASRLLGPAADSGGVWVGGDVEYPVPYPEARKISLRYYGYNQELLVIRSVAEPAFSLKSIDARDGSVYGGGQDGSTGGFVFKVTGPGAVLTLISQIRALHPGSMSHLENLMREGDWTGCLTAVESMIRTGTVSPKDGETLVSMLRDVLGQ